MKYYQIYTFDIIGTVTAVTTEDCITHLSFGDCSSFFHPSSEKLEQRETALLKQLNWQLREYVEKKRTVFTVPFSAKGTPFQEKVWHQLCQIPYGCTETYKEIAIAIGNQQASRAVGMANNKNPINILIPCHRVIGSNGSPVGYAGGLNKKIQLLHLEGNNYVYR
ncbi:methylated-DNA--[protein]-cysteine S-methyltransferase [Filifactor alocis]